MKLLALILVTLCSVPAMAQQVLEENRTRETSTPPPTATPPSTTRPDSDATRSTQTPRSPAENTDGKIGQSDTKERDRW